MDAMHNHFLEARKDVLGEQNVSYMKDVATISYCSGTKAFVKAQAMEYSFVDIISKVILKAREMGQGEKIFTFNEMIVDNGEEYWNKVFIHHSAYGADVFLCCHICFKHWYPWTRVSLKMKKSEKD